MNAKRRSRRSFSALVCLLLVLLQAALVGAAVAQTYEPQYTQGPQGNDGGQAQGGAENTQNTVPNPYLDAKGFVPITNNSADVNVHGGSYNGGSTRGIQLNSNDLLKRDNPYGMAEQPGMVQPRVFVEKDYAQNAPSGLLNDQMTALQEQNRQLSSLALQSAEQGMGTPQNDTANLLNSGLGNINETYRGMHQFFNDDIIGNLFSQIGQLIGKWVSELINGWIADTVQFLASFLRVFVLNPNIAVNGLNGGPSDGISPYIRQGADVMYGIAVDLLLLLFILAIWKYWAEASWRGGSNLMGAVGRLIFTAGLMIAFPTLYAFEIQITNEMIKAIYFNSSDQVMMLDAALASAIKGGILAGVGGLASAFAPILGGLGLGFIGGTVGQIFAFAGLVIFLILGGILIAELVYLLVLKAIQTALLTAQYMFAPVFLVFFATPDTENIASGFVRAWVETSLWTFVWVGLLKILVIIMFSDYNPWGKILICVGVLQMMIQVPTFLARAQISPMSDFISAGLIFGGLMKMFGAIGGGMQNLLGRGISSLIADRTSRNATGTSTQTNTPIGTPETTRNFSTLSKAGQGDPDAIKKLDSLRKNPKDPSTDPAAAAATGATPPVVPPGAAGAKTGTGVPPAKTGTTPTGTPAGTPAGTPSGTKTDDPAVATPTGAAASGAKPPTGTTGATGTASGAGAAGGTTPTPATAGGATPPTGTPPTGAGKTAALGTALAAGLGAGAAVAGARPTGFFAGVTGSSTAMNPDEDPKKWEEARLSTGYFSNQNLYGVDAVRGIVAGIKTLGVRVREDQKENSIEGTTRGGAAFVNLRSGATDGEKARTLMVAGLANRMTDDPMGADAARNSAVKADAGGPQGLAESLAANWMSFQGQDWRSTPIGKWRMERGTYQQAVKGAEAYLNGQEGNDYTQYLQGRYGRWTPDKDAMATWIATDPTASESAWNPAIGPATDALQASGLAITPATRGAIQNPYVMTMRPGARKAAVRSLLRAAMQDSRMDGFDVDTTEGAILLGEIARGMPETDAKMAIAMDQVSGGQDLAPDILRNQAQLSEELKSFSAAQTYVASTGGLGTVAADISGVQGMRGASSFQQVRRLCYAQFGAEEGQYMFETIVKASNDRVKMMDKAGIEPNMTIDRDFARQVDDSVASYAGGYVNIDDPGMADRRDQVQTVMQAAGIAVRHFGTAGFTPGRTGAVLKWISDGNNANQISAQEIIAVERFMNSPGAGSVSPTVVSVFRQIAPAGVGPVGEEVVHTTHEIANHVTAGNARVDQARAVQAVMGSGTEVTKRNVEVAARLISSPGGYNQEVYRVQANILAQDVVQNSGDAQAVFNHTVRLAARERGIDSTAPITAILGELADHDVTPQWIEQRISQIHRGGGFDSRQMVSPAVMEVAYEASSDFSDNAHRLQSIQIAERVHGSAALHDEQILEVYDTVMEAGVDPRQMNQQRYYAARALHEARQTMTPSNGGQCPPPTVRVLDRIRQDSRFRMDQGNMKNPPKMDQSMYDDLCQSGDYTTPTVTM